MPEGKDERPSFSQIVIVYVAVDHLYPHGPREEINYTIGERRYYGKYQTVN
jgi:hypothetical protein